MMTDDSTESGPVQGHLEGTLKHSIFMLKRKPPLHNDLLANLSYDYQ